ncbi:acyl-CoA synthetase [Phaeovulum vinaykumarii]|uniref:Fatty-acyl-CoA synthase n=1 Tax=Phaeovulum vinaykumarii TaxID=407234 RepID=A0A1N7L6L2_9RHOB|nr:acyl-CoA synthetase [Phaeovulum vinaykumarii]SIS69454.1 fatty-acyl-CoA synthase [Phaeovulum vinaykumarii]SOB99482.1 fatty-acyl-CoA synthase [Phaeovulum vinaykumarii]
MSKFASVADRDAVEAEMDWAARPRPHTIHAFLSETRARHPDRPAVSFQLLSDPDAPAQTLNWAELHDQVTRAANLFRRLGVGPSDTVAYLLPNTLETAVTLLAGSTAGIVNPINPLLDAEQIAGILRETKARVLVTLKGFPKTDIAQKAAEAVAQAPDVKAVLEVDLLHYLTGPKRLIVPLIRPRVRYPRGVKVMDMNAALAREPATLAFDDPPRDRVAAYFHTGGTTGTPKVAQHKYSGMIYNGWLGGRLLFGKEDVLICPLPLFHVFAAYPILMSCIASGAHMVMPTPAGYRGDGVFDNFWKLIERWQVTFLITVPTALAALMQRPVNADVSSLKTAISGSAPLPIELYNRFETATGVQIAEGYGLTEATCLVSCNPPGGTKKVGSVGIPLPHTHVRILARDGNGGMRECAIDEVGEICVANPGVFEGSTYTEPDRNHDLFAEDRFLRTGDLGRIDPDGYLWITGRAKDLIIRGGHNIDPAEIESALLAHPDVSFAGAIGQPDAFAGELPCAYVELVRDATVTAEALMEHARAHIHERAAIPKHIEILKELPKTAVGKVFKPDLRKRAIARVYNGALAAAGHDAEVAAVTEDRKRGLVAHIRPLGPVDKEAITHLLGEYTSPWDWAN